MNRDPEFVMTILRILGAIGVFTICGETRGVSVPVLLRSTIKCKLVPISVTEMIYVTS